MMINLGYWSCEDYLYVTENIVDIEERSLIISDIEEYQEKQIAAYVASGI